MADKYNTEMAKLCTQEVPRPSESYRTGSTSLTHLRLIEQYSNKIIIDQLEIIAHFREQWPIERSL